MKDDAELLREYAETGSEEAFAELVRVHVSLVYATAMRRTGDSHRAADVTQEVFTNLAKQSRRLVKHTSLAAWLHTATRNAAINLMISENRRRLYESEAAAVALVDKAASSTPEWSQLRPVLDAAIDDLPESDRVAIVLRFLNRQSFAAVGVALQVSEDAARMRTERALDRLRSVLARHGISSSAAALSLLIANQPAIAVPVSLAVAVTSAALAGGGAAVGGSLATAMLFMNQKIVIPAVAAMLTFGVAVFQANKAAGLRAELDATSQNVRKETLLIEQGARKGDQDAREIERLRAEIERLGRASAEALSANAPRAAAAAQLSLGLAEGTDVSSKLQQRYPNGVVAVVGSRAILAKDVVREISPQQVAGMKASVDSEQAFSDRLDQAVSTVIQNLIDRELTVQEFRKDNAGEEEIRKIPDSYIDTEIAAQERDDFGGDHAKFLTYIQSLGMSRSEYRRKLEDDIAFRYMLGQLRLPTDSVAGNETPAQRRDAFLDRLRNGGTVRRF